MWTYLGDPAASSRDAVRFLVGQTSSGDDVLLADEEIAWTVAQTPNSYYAAAQCADALASRYRGAGRQSETIGDTSITWGDRAKEFRAVAADLRRRAAITGGVTPFIGGMSVTDQETREADSDLRQPAFQVDQFDYEGASTVST